LKHLLFGTLQTPGGVMNDAEKSNLKSGTVSRRNHNMAVAKPQAAQQHDELSAQGIPSEDDPRFKDVG
jgi:hypothetical protein